MAFNLSWVQGGYGSGSQGALTPPTTDTVINSYAQVTSMSGKTFTVGNTSNSAAFTAGSEILLHVSAYTGTASYLKQLGYWKVVKIVSVADDVITTNKDLSDMITGDSNVLVQAVTIPQYTTVTINAETSISCPQFDSTVGYGGIVAFKCSKELKLNGGHIDLAGKGLPTAAIRPNLNQESASAPSATYSAYQNYMTYRHFTLNYPDGAAFIIAKKLTCHEDSRIGNPNLMGIARDTGHYSAYSRIVGGSTILSVAEEIENWTPKVMSKFSSRTGLSSGGLCRCYIASETILPNDEGLYAFDRISTPSRMSKVFNVKSFGDGSDNARSNYTSQVNNYAQVVAIDKTRKVFTIANKTTDGLAKFKAGALVMIHASQKKYVRLAGTCMLAKILSINLNTVTVDTAFAPDVGSMTVANYDIQLIAVPQFTTFTLSKINSATPKFANGRGGIFAIAVNDTCNLSGGQILVEGKGAPESYGATGLDYIGNAAMAEKLPLGQGNGSVFILAQNLIMDASTRIGASWSGLGFGGLSGNSSAVRGWGHPDSTGLYGGGSGQAKGAHKDVFGGWAGNAGNGDFFSAVAKQGAHILIIADKITGLSMASLSTGGQGGTGYNTPTSSGIVVRSYEVGGNGGCGYGGGGASASYNTGSSDLKVASGGAGGYHGGAGGGYSSKLGYATSGGGAGGFCFIYCNTSASQTTTQVIIH